MQPSRYTLIVEAGRQRAYAYVVVYVRPFSFSAVRVRICGNDNERVLYVVQQKCMLDAAAASEFDVSI